MTMTESRPAREPLERALGGEGRQPGLLHRAFVLGLFVLFGLVLVAIVVVLVIVITHGGGIHMVE